jgi:hypothetical protein
MKLDKFETTPFHCEMGGDSSSPKKACYMHAFYLSWIRRRRRSSVE